MSTHLGTITSKMQLTIPMAIARKLKLNRGDKMLVAVRGVSAVLTPMKDGKAGAKGGEKLLSNRR